MEKIYFSSLEQKLIEEHPHFEGPVTEFQDVEAYVGFKI